MTIAVYTITRRRAWNSLQKSCAILFLIAAELTSIDTHSVLAQQCVANFMLEDHSSLVVKELYFASSNSRTNNLLAAVVDSNGGHQWIKLKGAGQGQFEAVLAGDRVIRSDTIDICAVNRPSEIVIFEDFKQYHMNVR
jgi:hypothetical protein